MKLIFTNSQKGMSPVTFVEGSFLTIDHKDPKTIWVGVGSMKEGALEAFSARSFTQQIAKVIRFAKAHKVEHLWFDGLQLLRLVRPFQVSEEELGRLFGEAVTIANYDFVRYKTDKKKLPTMLRSVAVGHAGKNFQRALKSGMVVGQAVNWARDLANTPAADMTPQIFHTEVRKKLEGRKTIDIGVFHADQIEALGLGGIYAVGKGAKHPPLFLIATYRGNPSSDACEVALVGKGVCFDSGGLNVKTGPHMLGMHEDMAGAAAVVASLDAIANLRIKKNVVALAPLVENAVSRDAYRPGDIITMFSGATVEVLNTDAEGRIILADALAYATKKFKPKLLLETSTLTGAAMRALGLRYTGLFSRQDDLAEKLTHVGKLSGDEVWRLPVSDLHEEDLKKSMHADIGNIPAGDTPLAGASLGAAFLHYFVDKKQPFAHLDIAPTMDSIEENNVARGATGSPVRLFVRMIEEL